VVGRGVLKSAVAMGGEPLFKCDTNISSQKKDAGLLGSGEGTTVGGVKVSSNAVFGMFLSLKNHLPPIDVATRAAASTA